MLIQEAGEPHDDHMAPINIDSNYSSSITLKPYYILAMFLMKLETQVEINYEF